MSQLHFELLRNNNSFLFRTKQQDFTTHPQSTNGRQSYSGCALIQNNGISLQQDNDDNVRVSIVKRQRFGCSRNINESKIVVKHGVQSLRKVISKRFQHNKAIQAQALKKAVLLNKAIERRKITNPKKK